VTFFVAVDVRFVVLVVVDGRVTVLYFVMVVVTVTTHFL
jgi:hypothetical protein